MPERIDAAELAVGVASYEEPERIVVAVAALLAQRGPTITVRVFDDSRTDRVRRSLSPLVEEDPRLSYHRNPVRLGLAGNCQQAMRWAASQAPFCALAADHDVTLPGWADALVQVLRRRPEVVLAAPITHRLDASGHRTGEDALPVTIEASSAWRRMARAVDIPRVGDLVYGIFRAEAFARLPFHATRTPDRLLIIEACALGGIAHVPEVLYHRVDQQSRTESDDLPERQRRAMLLQENGRAPWWSRNTRILLLDGFRRPRVTGPLLAAVAATAYGWRYVRRRSRRRWRRSLRRLRLIAGAATRWSRRDGRI